MTPFLRVQSVAAPMPADDIDTDIIFPARFLLITDKHGLGRYAFHDQRHDAAGDERPDFVLHRAPWRGAELLVAGANFGCGSSREQAPWALADLGLRCIVAPSFGEIFAANCVANGMLPLVLDPASHARVLIDANAGLAITVDLQSCQVTLADGSVLPFTVPADRRADLLQGADAIDAIRRDHGQRIAAFEAQQRQRMPWLFETPPGI